MVYGVRFEVPTEVVIFWDIASCSPNVSGRVGGTSISAARWCLSLDFRPEDGRNTFVRIVDTRTDYTALHPRRWQHLRYILSRTTDG
jgi:hypothetical protein